MKKKRLIALCLSVCLLFGVLPAAVVAEDGKTHSYTVEEITVVGTSMRVSADLSVLFYVAMPEGVRPYSVGVYVDEVYYAATRDKESGLYVAEFRHIAPYQMAVIFTVVPCYVKTTGQVEVRGASSSFSVCDYAETLLSDAATPAEMKTMLRAMLCYGAAAQIRKNYMPGRLPTRSLTPEEKEIPERTFPDAPLTYLDGTEDGIGNARFTAAMIQASGTGVAFRFFVDIDGQENLRVNGGNGIESMLRDYMPNEEANLYADRLYVEIAPSADFTEAKRYPVRKYYGSPNSVAVDSGVTRGFAATSDYLYAAEIPETFYVRLARVGQDPDGKDTFYGRTLPYSVALYAGALISEAEATVTPYRSMASKDRYDIDLARAMIAYGEAAAAYEATLLDNE